MTQSEAASPDWIVVPIKAPEECKTRLSGVLDAGSRQGLAAAMLRHVVETATRLPGAAVLLLGPSLHRLAPSHALLADPGTGLNQALVTALEAAMAAGTGRLVVVSADLPLLTASDLANIAGAAPDEVVIAPDRWDLGSNALSLPLPRAQRFRFAFGEGSFARHRAEAARLGLGVRVVRSQGLGFDVDTPDDLRALRHLRPGFPG